MAFWQHLKQGLRQSFVQTRLSDSAASSEYLPQPIAEGQVLTQPFKPAQPGLSQILLTFSADKKLPASNEVIIRLEILTPGEKKPLVRKELQGEHLHVFTRTVLRLPGGLLQPDIDYRLRLTVIHLNPDLGLKLHMLSPQNSEAKIDGHRTGMAIRLGYVYTRGKAKALSLTLLLLAFSLALIFDYPAGIAAETSRIPLLSFLLAPLAILFLTEALNELNERFWLRPALTILSYGIILLCQGLFWGITGSSRFAVFITLAIFILFAFANHLKQYFRGDPLFAADIPTLGMAMKGGDQLVYILQTRFLLAFWGILAFIAFFRNLKPLHYAESLRWVILACALVLSGLLIWRILLTETTARKLGLGSRPWNPMADYRTSGFIVPFLRSSRDLFLKPPQKKGTIDKSFYTAKKSPAKVLQKPNIIAIMSESFCDFRNIADFHTSEPVLPFFDHLRNLPETRHGYLRVPIFGGGTSNTEFEYLTGSSMHFFSDASVPYLSFIKKPVHGMPDLLRQQGYRCRAVHPYDPTFYHRDEVYPRMGFDEFISLEAFRGAAKVGRFISDQSHFDKIMQLMQDKPAKERQFIFSVTMQNHFPYHGTEENLSHLKYHVRLPDLAEAADVELFLSRLRESDDALKNLIEKLQTLSEPTLLVFFGDHLPGNNRGFNPFYTHLFGQSLGELGFSESQKLYETPYLIWANFPLPPVQKPYISGNYLGLLTLDLAEAIRSPYYDFLKELQSDVPIFGSQYLQTQNEVLTASEPTGHLAEQLRRYWHYQHDNLFSS